MMESDQKYIIPKFSTTDYIVFIIMLAISAAIGVYYAIVDRKTTKVSDILVGSRSMGVFPVSMSVLATFMSAITLLGTPAEMYNYGTQYFIIILGYCLVIPATAYIYLPIFYKLEVTSAYEYLELRFGRIVRTLGSLTFIIQMIIYIAIVLYAPSLALSHVTGIKVWTCVASAGLVCTFYTAVGGIKAVVWTDVFQVSIMVLALCVTVFKGAADVGGWEKIWEISKQGQRLELFNFDVDPRTRHTVFTLVVGGYFSWLSLYAVNQTMVQRYVSISTLKGAKRALWINLPGLSFLLTITSLAGLVIYTKYHMCDPQTAKLIDASDQLFPLFVMDTLRFLPGLAGLFVSGIVSAALSSVSSGVNSLAAVTLEDLILTYICPDLSDVAKTKITKIMVVFYGLLCMGLVAVVELLGNVLQAAFIIVGVFGGPMLGIFTLGMFLPWANSIGAVVGLFSGLITANWVGFGSIIYKHTTPMSPISTEGCLSTFNIYINDTLKEPVQEQYEINDIYKISYMYFCTIGCIVAFIIGALVSLITGCKKSENINPKLIIPIFDIFSCISPKFPEKLRFNKKAKSSSASIVLAANNIEVNKAYENHAIEFEKEDMSANSTKF